MTSMLLEPITAVVSMFFSTIPTLGIMFLDNPNIFYSLNSLKGVI